MRGHTSRTYASPGAERAGAAVRLGHHRWQADGRCARHERSAPAGDHAVEVVFQQPGYELAGAVGAVFDVPAADPSSPWRTGPVEPEPISALKDVKRLRELEADVRINGETYGLTVA